MRGEQLVQEMAKQPHLKRPMAEANTQLLISMAIVWVKAQRVGTVTAVYFARRPLESLTEDRLGYSAQKGSRGRPVNIL